MNYFYEIKTATAEYTGGGIYIYYGELSDGNFFRIADGWECAVICDADTSADDAEYDEFYEEHTLFDISGYDFERFFNVMIDLIIQNKPDGNYDLDELKRRKYSVMDASIEIERPHPLAEKLQEQVKQAKFDLMINHQIKIIKEAMSEYKNEIRFIFDDAGYYNRNYEKPWRSEFIHNATLLFEHHGYFVYTYNGYSMIKW